MANAAPINQKKISQRMEHKTRIRLESFTEEDFERLISWIDHEELLVQFAGAIFSYPLTAAQLANYLSDEKRFAFKVVEVETGATIGHAEIYLTDPDTARLCRILIGNKERRGKGTGRQIVQQLTDDSFERLHVEVVELNVYDWNTAAIKCYEKAGFKINSNKSKTVEVNGKVWTAINMRIRKSERKGD